MKNRLQFFSSFLVVFIFLGFTSTAFSQTAEIPNHYESYELQSGYFNGNGQAGSEAVNVFTGTIEFQNIPWLMVHFSDANLGENSYMIITSLYDNLWQKLDAVSIRQWNFFSAFFNGSVVEIKLFVDPMDKQVFFKTDEVMVGEWVNNTPPESICGSTDDRIASDQPATGRLVSIGCTAWIIPNGKFVTAGHCLDATSGTVVEFQVPMSLPNGTIQHPSPEDQYSVDVTSKIFVNGGVGNDWGVFEVFPNSITGLMPKEAQGAYWPLAQDLGPDSIRITGYGVDGPPPGFGNGARDSTNQTQQTHVGPNAGSSGTTMRYVTDTQGGNSGSPVIDALTNTAVGVHTHGGCSSSGGNNSGTSFFLTVFWDAVSQGTPVELASFTANVNEGNVTLNWLTASETNNQGFDIERKSSASKFEKIGFISGIGTSTESHSYTFTDKNVETGNYSYRLKQLDYDGTFEYSNEINVDVTVPLEFALDQNYPNPFNPSTTISYSIPVKSRVTLKIFNALGKEIITLVNEEKSEGNYDVKFDASGIPSGIYFYKLNAGEFSSTKKMILLK